MRNYARSTGSHATRQAAAAVAMAVAAVAAGATGIAAGPASAAASTAGQARLLTQDAKFKHPRLAHGLLAIVGTRASDKIALRLKAGNPGVLQVDVGNDGSTRAAGGSTEQDIVRLDVSMLNILGVEICEAAADIDDDLESLTRADMPT